MASSVVTSIPMTRTFGAARSTSTVRSSAVGRKALCVKATASEPASVTYAKTLPGITEPFPNLFDPANLLATATVEDVRRWREAEIMHSRVAMLAAVGFVVGEQLEDFPAFMNFDGSITGPAINHFQQVQQGFWEPLLIVIGICESYRVSLGWAKPDSTGVNKLLPEYEMGNLMFDPLGMKPEDPEELKVLQNKELNNGRLAMVSIAGFVAQEFVNKTEIFQHLFRYIEEEIIEELDDIEMELGLPITPIPEIVLRELGQL